ncbi:MAG: hypothetical protein VW771_12005, partial [Gammaproteobacteria bacterium]
MNPNSTEAFDGVDRDTISYVKFKGIRDTTNLNLSLDIAVNGERVFIDPRGALDEIVEEFGVVKDGKVTDPGMLAVEMEGVIRSEMEISETSREETKENYPEMFKILEAAESGQEITIWNPPNVTVYAAFNPNQIKSADPFTGVPIDQRFNPESDSIQEAAQRQQPEIAPVFTSKLKNLIEQKVEDKASSQQVAGMIGQLQVQGPDGKVKRKFPSNQRDNADVYAEEIDGKVQWQGPVSVEELKFSNIDAYLEANPKSVTRKGLLDFLKTSQPGIKEIILDGDDRVQYEQAKTPGGRNYREILFIYEPKPGEGTSLFTEEMGSHWSQPNVMYHAR